MKNAIKTCAAKALAVAAFGIAFAVQAEYVRPGITINGTTPSKDGTYSGYTYKDGMFTLTSSGATYTFAGQDTSGNVCINAAVGCTIVLTEGFKLDLRALDSADRAPILLSTTVPVEVRVDGIAYLYGPSGNPGLRVNGGQTVVLTQGSADGELCATGGAGSAGIGSGMYYFQNRTMGCGTIYVRCKVRAIGQGSSAGIGEGSGVGESGTYEYEGTSAIIIDSQYSDVYSVSDVGIGKCNYSPSKMTIKISAGTVQPQGYSGAGIGTGEHAHGSCDITISGGSVSARGGEHSAGIGSGYLADTAMDINITGGIAITAGLAFEPQIIAYAGVNAACIGTGYKSESDMSITISGGYVQAYDAGANAAGIGGGYSASVPSITITGGTVLAEGDPDVASVDDIGAGRDPKNSAVCEVTGGNIRLIKGKGRLTNGGTALNCVRVEGLGGNSYDPVSVSLTTAAGAYGNNDIRSFANRSICLWVLPGNYVNKLRVNGVRYDFDATSGNVTALPYQPVAVTYDTVTFVYNGPVVRNYGEPYKTADTYLIPHGNSLGALPEPPAWSGHTFLGWYTAKDGGTKVTAETVVDGETYYYAHWTDAAATCKVTFGKNGGTDGSDSVQATKGQPMPAATAPTKAGYVFDGYWDTTKEGGKQYYDKDMKSVRNWDKTGNVTLWAKWEKAVSVKVTFGKNGGTGGDSYVTATTGKPMPTPRTAPTQSGWTFAGYWDTLAMDEKGTPKGKQYYDASMKSVRNWDKTTATTLWAKWTNKVTFGKNGGTGGDNYVTCTKGQPMPKRTMPTKSGYAFAGYWNTTGTGGVKYYNADGTSAHAWDRSGNVTLWAKWEKAVSVKVTFGKNGGTGGDNYVTCTTGKPMPTPRTAPKRTGWTFDGYWDTLAVDANGNPKGKQYYDKDMKSVRIWDKPTATTLWAKWTVKVTLGKNGGTGGDSSVIVTYNQPFPKATMPTRAGYTFGGYFVSASKKTGQCYNANGTPTASMKWTTGGTPTVWALWTKTASCVELSALVAYSAVSAASAVAEPDELLAGLYSGVLADGSGTFCLMLDEQEEGYDRTAFLYIAAEDGVFAAECIVEGADGVLLLTTEDGEVYAFDPKAGTLGFAMGTP